MNLYQHGIDLTMVSQWLGRANLSTALIYVHVDTEMKRKAMEEATGDPFPKVSAEESSYDVNDDAYKEIVVGTGGFIGAVCRYLIGMIPIKEVCIFPIKTFIINITGCFLIGIVSALGMKTDLFNPKLILFLKVGICGGFTTYSSFALETTDLMKDGKMYLAAVYAALSIVLGVLAVFAGQGVNGKLQ